MSKAEERTLHYATDIYGYIDSGKYGPYINGFQQAEKDLALTWEDIENIYRIQYEVECDYSSNAYRMNNDRDHSEKVFKEVLRRFKEIKNK